MSKYFIVPLFLLTQNIAFGQSVDTIWYNKTWVKTENRADYYYYSIVRYDSIDSLFYISDFYPNGKIQMSGSYVSMESKIKKGEFTWFYQNGQKKLQELYFYDTLLITESFKEDGSSLGKIFKKVYIETLSPSEKEKLGIIEIDERAKFPGGDEKYKKYLSKKFIYPAEAKEKKIEGRVIVSFEISKRGKIKNIKTNNFDPILDMEAIRLVSSMPRWIPARNHGKRVIDHQVLSFNFKLE